MELKQITENVYYIPNPAIIGVVSNGKNAILIDSGLDDDTGRKILRTLENNGLFPKAIINTHSHADHCGGNAYIKEKTRALVFAPEIEAAIIQYPYLEPLYLFSGASPLKDLKNKFLMARPCQVDRVIASNEKTVNIEGVEIGIVPLPGHSPNQIGIEIENILFCADSVFSQEVLSKHRIPFYMDIGKQRETLSFLKNSSYGFYVPSHAEPSKSIAEIVNANINVIDEVEQFIINNFHGEKTTEQILKGLWDHYKIEIKGIQQYCLMRTTALAYLSSLYKQEKLQVNIKENTLYWKRV